MDLLIAELDALALGPERPALEPGSRQKAVCVTWRRNRWRWLRDEVLDVREASAAGAAETKSGAGACETTDLLDVASSDDEGDDGVYRTYYWVPAGARAVYVLALEEGGEGLTGYVCNTYLYADAAAAVAHAVRHYEDDHDKVCLDCVLEDCEKVVERELWTTGRACFKNCAHPGGAELTAYPLAAC